MHHTQTLSFRRLAGGLLLTLWLCLPALSEAQTNCQVSGFLFRPNGLPAANETVFISKAEQGGVPLAGFQPITAVTDADGFVTFSVPADSEVWLRAQNVDGLNNLDGVPLVIPVDATADLALLWHRAEGVLSFNGRAGDVSLTGSDISTALGYIPTSASGIIAAINASTESLKIGDAQLSDNIPKLNAVNNFTTLLSTQGVFGGTAPASSLALAGTNNPTPSAAHITLNGAGQGNVLVGGATDRNSRLHVIGANGSSNVAVSITKGTSSASALDFVLPDTSGKALRFFTPGWPEAHAYFNARGAFYSRAWMVISGKGTGTGNGWHIQPPSTDPFMLGVWSDVLGPAFQVRGSQGKSRGSYLFAGLDSTGKYTFSIEEDGELRWGATTRAALDTSLYRSAPSTLRTPGNLVVDGGMAIASTSVAADAILDVNGGDTRGLRLRPRSVAGAPNSGTWSTGTMIVDAAGGIHTCVAGGSPGTWRKLAAGDPDTGATSVVSFNNRTGDVALLGSDVTAALGYTPANVANAVSSFNGRAGNVTLTAQDVSNALGYAPVSPANIITAFNSSTEAGPMRRSTSGGTMLKFAPTDPASGAFNISVNGGFNPGSERKDWTMTWGYNQTTDGGRPELAGEPALSHRIESFWAPGGLEAMEAHLQYVSASGATYRPYGYFINRNANTIQLSHEVDDMVLIDAKTKTAYLKFLNQLVLLRNGTTILAEKNNTRFLQQRNAANTASIPLTYLDATDRVTVGNGANPTIVRASNATINTSNVDRLTVTSTGNIGVATSAPVADAVVDIDGGSSKGFRLRPRTSSGSPSTGTWSIGTMIMDKDGVLFVCTATGTPGTWIKVGAQ